MNARDKKGTGRITGIIPADFIRDAQLEHRS